MEGNTKNSMTMNDFTSNLNSENASYIQDSFGSMEDALDFYLQCAANDVNGGAGIYNDVNMFFNQLRSLNSLEFI